MNFDYHGIEIADLSTYQDSPLIVGHVNYRKMRDWGFRAVGIRAGIGSIADADFEINWNNSRGILPRFTYFAHDPIVTPKEHANKYWNLIKSDREGPCVWDLEKRGATGGAFALWRQWYDCLTEFQMLSGLSSDWIWIYTGHFFFEEFTMSATDAQRAWFKQFPLWLASYPQDPFHPNYADIKCPRPWSECVMLQSGTPAIGIEAGVESKDLDYNQWNGGEASFARYFSGVTPQPEPEREPEATMQGTVKTLTNIRNSPPGGTYNDIGDLLGGDIVTGTTEPFGGVTWWHLTNATRNGQPVITTGGLNVSQRGDCWAYGPNIEVIGSPEPPAGLPVLNVTVSGEGYESVIVELRPR
jgi:GH25 family lysozyme M1 (1,4-beta-N-acetylmuramidase)